MMKPRFTPGPWSSTWLGPKGWVLDTDRSCLVSTCTYSDDERQRINTKLMAAAPEMLETLVSMEETISDLFDFNNPGSNPFAREVVRIRRLVKMFYEQPTTPAKRLKAVIEIDLPDGIKDPDAAHDWVAENVPLSGDFEVTVEEEEDSP